MAPQDVLPYFQIAGQVALMAGALFAAYQLWLLERNRKEQAELQTLNAFNTNEFRHAFARVNTLPLGAPAQETARLEEEATTVLMTFEMLGAAWRNGFSPSATSCVRLASGNGTSGCSSTCP